MTAPLLPPPPTATSERHFATDFYVEGIASQFGVKYLLGHDEKGAEVFETIDPGALEGCDLSDVIFQYDHEGKVYARTSNGTLFVEGRPDALFMAADLSKSRGAMETYEEIKAGLITQMSFSFIVGAERFDRAERCRHIQKITKVYDVSAVSIPANPSTYIDARSAAERIVNADRQELQRARRRKLLLQCKILEVMK